MIGRRGRSLATTDAVRPVNVGTRIAFAPSVSARSQAAFDIACPTVGSSPGCGNWCRYPMLGSIVRAIRSIVRDRLERVLADRRLPGEHQRGRAVEDRVRDVARLGARRLGVAGPSTRASASP